jgi:thiol-disulfide isomerase/thioredoxin
MIRLKTDDPMTLLKTLLLFLSSTFLLEAQSFYSLTGVDSYDQIVVNAVPKTKQFNKDIKTLMTAMSNELGIDTKGHDSRVLVFVLKRFSVGDSIGIKVALELGEYVKRKGYDTDVFAVTYMASQIITPNDESLEDQLADSIEELLESFRLQHIEDNKERLAPNKSFNHEAFAKVMQYETDYDVALAKAKKEKKALMVFMSTSYCPWCRKLESQILAKESIDAKIHEKYVPVMLNYDKKKFPEKLLKIKITPTLYIINSESGKIEEKVVGYNNRSAFLHLLKE